MSFNHKNLLSANQLRELRESNTINSDEYAYVAGDLVVAENIKTSEKRVLGEAASILKESSKRVLKG